MGELSAVARIERPGVGFGVLEKVALAELERHLQGQPRPAYREVMSEPPAEPAEEALDRGNRRALKVKGLQSQVLSGLDSRYNGQGSGPVVPVAAVIASQDVIRRSAVMYDEISGDRPAFPPSHKAIAVLRRGKLLENRVQHNAIQTRLGARKRAPYQFAHHPQVIRS